MAERRMMSKKIIHSDAFMDMPVSSQNLYFYLLLDGDDDGFVNSPKRIQRLIGASDDDAKILLAKKFIISFDSGVIVIKHWKMHNYIQKDRYKPTSYTDERSKLTLEKNNVYTMDTACIQNVHVGKDRLGEVRLGEVNNTVQKTKFEIFIDEVKEVFKHKRIATFNAKINTTKATKDAFSNLEVIPKDLHIRYADYIALNRSKGVRLDRWLVAVMERNEQDINYGVETPKEKRTTAHDAVDAYFSKKNYINAEVCDE